MRIRAKFIVEQVTKHRWGGETVKMSPVMEGSTSNKTEDKHFSDATPSGSIELTISNKDVHGHFAPGSAHYVTFEPAEA